jgi:uncharacterized membrane protein YgcG
MGIAIGIVLIAATVISFVMINARVGRMAQRYSEPWKYDTHDGQQVPPEHGSNHGGHHGGHHVDGGHSGGGHHGGFSGGHGGGFSGGHGGGHI